MATCITSICLYTERQEIIEPECSVEIRSQNLEGRLTHVTCLSKSICSSKIVWNWQMQYSSEWG